MIPISKPYISDLEISYVTEAVSSGWVSSLGEFIRRFERAFADYCGVEYALTICNGTAALHLALESLGVGVGDEVIIPDLTFVATGNAVKYTGAKPVCVDINADDLCINVDEIRKAITPRTKAIIPVHLYGSPAQMEEIMKLAKEHDLFVVEDCAEAHGAELNGKKVGSFGDCGIFSFYGNKIITTGEGGMLITNNKHLYEKAAFLRDHAMSPSKRYWHDEVGYNYRMTNLQAALGMAQMERIDDILKDRERIFKSYKKHLDGKHGLHLNFSAENAKNAYWMITVIIDKFNLNARDKLMKYLESHSVDSRPFFYPLSSMNSFDSVENMNAYDLSSRGINLPTYYKITDEDIKFVCEQLNNGIDYVDNE